MKNKIFFIILLFFFDVLHANDFNISAQNIKIDKDKQITVFENDVIIEDEKKNYIKSDYAQFNKKKEFFILKGNIIIKDISGNEFQSENATYDKKNGKYETQGLSKIISSEGYSVTTEDLVIDLNNNIVSTLKEATIKDLDGNFISLDNFEYKKDTNIFKSVGKILLKDKNQNSYEFSQIYINEKKKEIIGSNAKAFLNQEDFKIDKKNKPRIFSNTINLKENDTKFIKSAFTICNYRENDKCPPWELLASEIRHNKKNKTVYYDNAIIKIYDIPIFYLPFLAHPDPSVKRRSGFLNPSFSDTKNLGASINLPYFWAIDNDKDFTLKNRVFVSEHPLFLGEYRQVFENSNLVLDFGYTKGYKNTTATKKAGEKSHIFGKFFKEFKSQNNVESNIEINFQGVSNKKYLKLYKIDSNLVDYQTNTLQNYIDFSRFDNDNNLFLGIKSSVSQTLTDTYNDKYEFTLPDLLLNKDFFTERFGYGDFESNLSINNYDTNKTERFLINNFDWTFEKSFSESLYKGEFLTKLKNVNYETKNVEKFKNENTSEFYGAVGYLATMDLIKYSEKNSSHLLKPKLLLRYAPNHMKKLEGDYPLYNENIFSLDRLGSTSNFEGGSSATIGFDYNKKFRGNELNFSMGQIINEKKTNKKKPSSSSLDKRFSDVVGTLNFDNKNNFKVKYNYALDQGYKKTNYNNFELDYKIDNISFNLNYMDEEKLLEKQEYVKSSIMIKSSEKGLFSFTTKRDLITDSSEYYKLSYEYLNDCLRAGLVYRREFYDDSELEAENSLMFTITLSPFASIESPSFEN